MFSDARAKLARANQHIADVERLIRAYLTSDFYRIVIEPEQGGTRAKVVLQSLHQPDDTIALATGDAISNIRSALDYAVVALTGKAKAAMPIADTAMGFKGKLASAFVVEAGIDAISTFICKIQAYEKGIGESIWKLNKLRNIDKHRFLLTATHFAGMQADFRDRNENEFRDCTMMISAGDSGTFISAPAGSFQFASQPRPVFQVVFNEPPYFADAPLVDVLKFLQGSATKCIETIERCAA